MITPAGEWPRIAITPTPASVGSYDSYPGFQSVVVFKGIHATDVGKYIRGVMYIFLFLHHYLQIALAMISWKKKGESYAWS